MVIFLDDSNCRHSLYPFTHTRHVADIRIGIFTIREKWMHFSGAEVFTNSSKSGAVCIPANIVPSLKNYKKIIDAFSNGKVYEEKDVIKLNYPWQIFEYNSSVLKNDFDWLSKNNAGEFDNSNHFIDRENIVIAPGAKVTHSVLNASEGPIYIGPNCVVMEGCLIRGPFAMLDGSVLKMGTKIYGASTLGPGCVVGGEIKNSVFFGYSNKAHDGYLGDSVIGEWCNIGAGSSNSNIKNNASPASYIIESGGASVQAGVKAGLLMGDYSRCAINTSFNTASVVGVCCNIFDNQIATSFTNHFAWGNTRYDLDKALADIEKWKQFKKMSLTDDEIKILKALYQS